MRYKDGEMIFSELHLFCGSGGGALGFQQAEHDYKGIKGRFETICGIDVDPLCCIDFEKLTGAPAIHMDLFDRSQYIDFFGKEPRYDSRKTSISLILLLSLMIFLSSAKNCSLLLTKESSSLLFTLSA